MYTKILVPLDGSERAEAILPHVESQAKAYGASVIFLQIIELDRTLRSPHATDLAVEKAVEHIEEQEDEATAYLSALVEDFKAKGIEADYLVEWGTIVERIIRAAEREVADLIAIASHGRTSLPRVFYGSVAAGILQRVDRPLLLIRSR